MELDQLQTWPYTTTQGETRASIAQRLGIDENELETLNPGMARKIPYHSGQYPPGEKLLLPVDPAKIQPSQDTAPAPARVTRKQRTAPQTQQAPQTPAAPEPLQMARPTDWSVIQGSKEWAEATPERRLDRLKDHAQSWGNYLAQNGMPEKEALDQSKRFFNAWRLNALDNQVPIGEHATSELITGISDMVFGSIAGPGLMNQASREADRAESLNTKRSITPAQQETILRKLSTLKTEKEKSLYRDELRDKHDIVVFDWSPDNVVADYVPGLRESDGSDMTSVVSNALVSIGEGWKEATKSNVEKLLSKNPRLAESFLWGDLPRGTGNALGFLAVGAVTGGYGVAAAGSGLQAESAYFTGKREGASEQDILGQMAPQAVIGMSESFGLGGKVKLLKETPFGRWIEHGVQRYLFGGAKETAQELLQNALTDVSEKYGNIDPARNPFDLEKAARTAGVAFITGSTLTGLERSDSVILLKAQKALNEITIDQASAVLDGSHPAVQAVQGVLSREDISQKDRDNANLKLQLWQNNAKELLQSATTSNQQVAEMAANLGGSEQAQASDTMTPMEKVGLNVENQVNLRDASDEEFARIWKNEPNADGVKDGLGPDERRRIRETLGVPDNAPIAKIRDAFREHTKDVTVEPDLATMALPELIQHHEKLSQERGETPSKPLILKTSEELDQLTAANVTPEAQQAAQSAVGKDVNPDDLQTLGANWVEKVDGVRQASVAIVEGKTSPYVYGREKAQEWARAAHDDGRFTLDEMREARKEVEHYNKAQDSHEWTDAGMFEWFSDYAMEYLQGKAPEAKSLPAKVREYLARLGEHLSEVVRRAVRLQKAIKAGAVNARFESALAQASGLQAGDQFDAYAGLSNQESAQLGRMLANREQAEAILNAEDVSDSVVSAFAEATRRQEQAQRDAGKIKVPAPAEVTTGTPEGAMMTVGRKFDSPKMTRETLKDHRRKLDEVESGIRADRAELGRVGLKAERKTVSIEDYQAGKTAQQLGLTADEYAAVKAEYDRHQQAIQASRERITGLEDGIRQNEAILGQSAKGIANRIEKRLANDRKELGAEKRNLKRLEARDSITYEQNAADRQTLAQRVRLIDHIRTLESVVNSMPKELRGALGGWAKLVRTGTPGKRLEQLAATAEKAHGLLEKHARNVVLNQIDSLVERNMGTQDQRRRLEGKIGPEATKELAEIDRVRHESAETVDARIRELDAQISQAEDADKIEELAHELFRLVRFGAMAEKNSADLFQAHDDLESMIATGKLRESVRLAEIKKQHEALRTKAVDTITGGKGLLDSAAAKREADKISSAMEKLGQYARKLVSWEWLLNAASRSDKSTGTLGSFLNKTFGRMVHVATTNERLAIGESQDRLARLLAEVHGIEPDKVGWRFKVSQAHVKFGEEQDKTGTFRRELPAGARYKQDVPISQAEQLRAGKLDPKKIGLTPGQEGAIYDALDEHNAEVAALRQNIADETSELARVPADDHEGIEASKRRLRNLTAKLNGKLRKTKLQAVELTDWSKAKNVEQRLSQDQALNLSMMWRQEDVRPTMEYHGWDQAAMDAIENFLTPQAKRIRDWLDQRYAEEYHEINAVYRRIYGADLPQVRHYSPLRFTSDRVKQDNLMDSMVPAGGSLSPGFLSGRIKHKSEPDQTVGALTLYNQHAAQAQHFIHWAEPMRTMRAVFSHKNTQEAIRQNGGDHLNRAIQERLQVFADNGVKGAQIIAWLDSIRRAHTLTSLAYNWKSFFGQLTSIPAVLYDMPTAAFLKYQAEFWSNPGKAWGTMWAMPYVKDRFGGSFDRDIMAVLNGNANRKAGGKLEAKSKLMAGIEAGMILGQTGDLVSVAIGGYAQYRHAFEQARKNGMTEAQAEEEARTTMEMAIDRNFQAGSLKDLSSFEMGGSISRALTMYLKSPLQYYQSTWEAFGDWRAGRKDAGKDLAKRVFIGHVLLPVLWQAVNDLARAPFNDDDEKDFEFKNYVQSVILGPLNGLFLIGGGIESGFAKLVGTKDFGTTIPIVEAMSSIGNAGNDFRRMIEDGINLKDLTNAASDIVKAYAGLRGNGSLVYPVADRLARSLGLTTERRNRLFESSAEKAARAQDQRWERIKAEAGIVQKAGKPARLEGDVVSKLQAMQDGGKITAAEADTLTESVQRIQQTGAKGLTKAERKLEGFGVASGARAAAMNRTLRDLPEAARQETMQHWKDVGLLSPTVEDQLATMR